MHPDRVFALVLYNSWARTAWAPDYPVGTSTDDLAAWRSEIAAHWGTASLAKRFLRSVAPFRADDPEWIRWEARSLRHGASPAAALAFDEFEQGIDVRSVLHTVQAPTLVLSRSEAARARSADLAARIPGARHVPVPGEDWMPYAGDIDVLLGEIERFVRSVHAEEATFERVLTTVLFTDLVSSTETAAQLGDHAWKGVVERHHATIRAMIGRYRGTEVDTAGDGFFPRSTGLPARFAARKRLSTPSGRWASQCELVSTQAKWSSSTRRSEGSPSRLAHVWRRVRVRATCSCLRQSRISPSAPASGTRMPANTS
jgi:hypothetical protein